MIIDSATHSTAHRATHGAARRCTRHIGACGSLRRAVALGVAAAAFAAWANMGAGPILEPAPCIRITPGHNYNVAIISSCNRLARLETAPWQKRLGAHVMVDQRSAEAALGKVRQ